MDPIIQGWTGDATAKIVGRLPNQLLITTSRWDLTSTAFLRQHSFGANADPTYPHIMISNLAHDSALGVAFGYYQIGNTMALKIAMIAPDDPNRSWKPGVNLFGITLDNFPSPSYNLMATAVIDSSLKVYHDGRLSQQVESLRNIYQQVDLSRINP